ncbi:MAG: DUF4421 domain-containing protein [Bacteroidaceae bacterium]|nr:DUF4421 domain-containing protein [Bacteroidaceae bacterium]
MRYSRFVGTVVQKISLALTLSTIMALPSFSQSLFDLDSLHLFKYPSYILDYTSRGIKYTNKIIDEHLDEKDTRYITPNLYKWSFMMQYSNCYEYYKFSARRNPQSITLSPDNSNKLGVYVGWKWIFLGWSFDLDRHNTKTDWNFSFYTSKVGIDVFHRKTGEGFRIRELQGFKDPVTNKEITPDGRLFDGISVEQSGLNLYYIFNNKHFSYPAAYSQSTNQRISCGTFIMGLSYSSQSFHMDAGRFDEKIREAMHPSINFNRVKYQDFSINAGYSYNWVFAKNCLANVSLTPALGYKKSKINTDEDRSILNNINVDFISRAAILYNNSRYFAGASIVSHTYTYRKSTISIVNSFGVINIYTGINLFRKKEKAKQTN